jgi:uncharacterized protein YegP (UPF0339 family)
MAGKFEVYKDKAGKFRFRLKAGNGEIIAVGEAYESKSGAMGGIESIRSNAMAAALVDLTDAPAPAARASAGASAKKPGPSNPSGPPASPGSGMSSGMSSGGSMPGSPKPMPSGPSGQQPRPM